MNHVRQITAILLSLSLFMTGCAVQNKAAAVGNIQTSAPVPKGRYVEFEAVLPIPSNYPDEEPAVPLAVIPHADGSVDCFLRSNHSVEAQDAAGSLRHYHTEKGAANWKPVQTSWLRQASRLLSKEAPADRAPELRTAL